jgi:uncharacterized protein YbjT (DUF2867 family)
MRREAADRPLRRAAYDLVGPDALTGSDLAILWGEVLGRPIAYGGDDTDAFEQRLKSFAPAWYAYDLKLMMRRYQQEGAVASTTQLADMQALLGRPPRTYRDFATTTAASWK